MPNVPNTNQPNMVLKSVGDGQNSSKWVPLSLQLDHTFSVSGTLVVPSGATGYLPPFSWPVPTGQTVTLISVRAFVHAGSVTANIQQNGSTIAGLSGIAITTTATTFAPTNPVAVASWDEFAPVLTAVSSADGLSCGFIFEVSV